jgi:hypothetical protein
MNTIQRWPFRLALSATTFLFAGWAVLLTGINALKTQQLLNVTAWQSEIVGAFLAVRALLAVVALWRGITLLLQYPSLRTSWNLLWVCSAGVSLILVMLLLTLWKFVMSALLILSYEGGWAAFGAHPPTTLITGRVVSRDGSIRSFPFIDNIGNLRIASVTKSNGCFYVQGPNAVNFGAFAPGYQWLKVSVGKGRFRATVNLSRLGASEPRKVKWESISTFQFIRERNACAGIDS